MGWRFKCKSVRFSKFQRGWMPPQVSQRTNSIVRVPGNNMGVPRKWGWEETRKEVYRANRQTSQGPFLIENTTSSQCWNFREVHSMNNCEENPNPPTLPNPIIQTSSLRMRVVARGLWTRGCHRNISLKGKLLKGKTRSLTASKGDCGLVSLS